MEHELIPNACEKFNAGMFLFVSIEFVCATWLNKIHEVSHIPEYYIFSSC